MAHTRTLPKADYQEAARLVGARVRARQTYASACRCALHAHLYRVRIGAHSENFRSTRRRGVPLHSLTSGSGWVEAVEAEVLRWNRSQQLETRLPKVSTIQLKGLHTNIQQISLK
jgi:hypothetical protein